MDKYDGMNKVDVNVSKVSNRLKKRHSKLSSTGWWRGLFFKSLIGGLFLAVIFSLHLIPHRFADSARDAIRTAVTFDMMRNDENSLGQIGVVERIREMINRIEEGEEE